MNSLIFFLGLLYFCINEVLFVLIFMFYEVSKQAVFEKFNELNIRRFVIFVDYIKKILSMLLGTVD